MENTDSSPNKAEKLHSSLLRHFFLSTLCSPFMLSHTKMTSKERFPANEAFSQIFDSESDLEENVPDTEDNLEEHDYEASSSDEIK